MGWQWVNNLFEAGQGHSRAYWEAQCPYQMCPSNQPYRRAHKSRLKFVMKVSPTVSQYKCQDCGCLMNDGVFEFTPEELKRENPAMFGGVADYLLRRR